MFHPLLSAPWRSRHATVSGLATVIMVATAHADAQPSLRQVATPGPAMVRASETPSELYDRAVALGRAERYDESIALLRRYRDLAPDSARGLLALGRTLAWARRFSESVAAYDSAARLDSTSMEAANGAAQSLAWSGQHRAALARYDVLLRRAPNDMTTRVAFATALGWSGQLDSAEAEFTRIARHEAAARAGERGLAQVATWRGNIASASARWRQLTNADATDAESWTGLSHARRWLGDARGAARAARSALSLDSRNREARGALAWANAEVGLTGEPTALSVYDSDGNHSRFYSASAGAAAPWRGRLLTVVSQRDAEFRSIRANSRTVRGVVSWSPGPDGRVSLRAEAGGTQLEKRRPASDFAAASGRLLGSLGATWRAPRASVGLSVAVRPFDEIAALIINGISTSSVEGVAEVHLPWQSTVNAESDWTRYLGGSTNTRRAGRLTWRTRASSWLTVGASMRMQMHSGIPLDGYFAPRRYHLAEATMHLGRQRELGTSAALELGVGSQYIRLASGAHATQPSRRISATVNWKPVPRFEVGASLDAGRMASTFTQTFGRYEYVAAGLRARVPLFR